MTLTLHQADANRSKYQVDTLISNGPAIKPKPLTGSVRVAVEPLLLTARDLARMLAVSLATVWRMKAMNKLPKPLTLGPQTIRWRAEEVREWIAADCPEQRIWELRKGPRR